MSTSLLIPNNNRRASNISYDGYKFNHRDKLKFSTLFFSSKMVEKTKMGNYRFVELHSDDVTGNLLIKLTNTATDYTKKLAFSGSFTGRQISTALYRDIIESAGYSNAIGKYSLRPDGFIELYK